MRSRRGVTMAVAAVVGLFAIMPVVRAALRDGSATTASSASSSTGGAPPGNEPIAEVLGLAPGMSEADTRRVLGRIGERAVLRGGSGETTLRRELWILRDRRYTTVLVAFDSEHRVRALQAYLKPRGPGLRFAEIGDLAQARRTGDTTWQWEVPARAGRPGRTVTARGSDPLRAGSVALRTRD